MFYELPILTQNDNWYHVCKELGRRYPYYGGHVVELIMTSKSTSIGSCIINAARLSRVLPRYRDTTVRNIYSLNANNQFRDGDEILDKPICDKDASNTELSEWIRDWVRDEFSGNPKYLLLLDLLSDGLSTRECAKELGITQSPVMNMIKNIREKMPYYLTKDVVCK